MEMMEMKRLLLVLPLLLTPALISAQPFSAQVDKARGRLKVFTTATLPATPCILGLAVFDDTTDELKICFNGVWNVVGGAGALTGSGTADRVAKWTGATALGNSAITDTSTFSGLMTIGVNSWLIGGASSATPANTAIRPIDALVGQTDLAGANLHLYGGFSTGNAEGGQIFLNVAVAGAASGSGQNTETQVARFGPRSIAIGTAAVRTPQTSTIQSYGGLGTDVGGSDLTLQAGAGTGLGNPGTLQLSTFLPAAATGSSVHVDSVPFLRTVGATGAFTLGGAGTAGDGVPSHITPGAVTVSGHIREGANLGGGILVLHGGPGNGTGVGGNTTVRYSPAGGAGSSQNTLSDAVTINGSTGNVDILTHLHASGTAPTLSSCGTTPSITGSDIAGKVTAGTGGTLQSCTLTFATAHAVAPACFANDETEILLLRAVSTTTTLVVDCAVAGCLTSDVFSYFCVAGS